MVDSILNYFEYYSKLQDDRDNECKLYRIRYEIGNNIWLFASLYEEMIFCNALAVLMKEANGIQELAKSHRKCQTLICFIQEVWNSP